MLGVVLGHILILGVGNLEQHIEPKVVMLAAECIRQKGSMEGGKLIYQQISLELSYDGYTIMLIDHKVKLTLFFHNKMKIECAQNRDLESFYEKLKNIARTVF